jgi:hypothetical protein
MAGAIMQLNEVGKNLKYYIASVSKLIKDET